MLNLLLAELPPGNPITFNGIDNIVASIMAFFTTLSGMVMVIALVLTGIMMIASQGDPKRFEAGKQMLKTTVIGSSVILGSSLIIGLLTSVFTGGFTLAPIEDLISGLVIELGDFIIGLSGVVMITFVVISGIMMATAGNDQTKFTKARQMLINVLWGSAVVMGSGVILNTLYSIVVTGTFFCRISVIGICLWY